MVLDLESQFLPIHLSRHFPKQKTVLCLKRILYKQWKSFWFISWRTLWALLGSISQFMIIVADHSFMEMDTDLYWVLYWAPWRQTLTQYVEVLSRSVLGGTPVKKSWRQNWAEAVGLQWDCIRHHSPGAVLPGNDVEIWAERFIVPRAVTRERHSCGPAMSDIPSDWD